MYGVWDDLATYSYGVWRRFAYNFEVFQTCSHIGSVNSFQWLDLNPNSIVKKQITEAKCNPDLFLYGPLFQNEGRVRGIEERLRDIKGRLGDIKGRLATLRDG